MPYFKNNDVNILLIHIPKTGGSSLEIYFSNKFKIPLNKNSLFVKDINYNIEINPGLIKYGKDIGSSLQHMTYTTIIKNNNYFNIDFSNIKIITIVRNPYNRIMSDLFYLKRINQFSTKEEVYDTINKFISEPSINNDNHNIPQHLFVIDENNENNKLIDNIIILRTETLMVDMRKLGYTDFNIVNNSNPIRINYSDYLNKMSLDLINKYYDADFSFFKYKKIFEI
jgi:hypothetical protein